MAPTWAEMDACVAACGGSLRCLATWLRYTGMRVAESLAVEWRDVDMATGLLTIRPEIDKMRTGRVVPLHPLLLDEIATWGKRVGWVVPGRSKGRVANERGMGAAWKRAGVREGAWRGHPHHAFRRGFKTGLLEAGASADAVDYLQGHALGVRGRYVEGMRLPLAETLAMVPVIGAPGMPRGAVFTLPQRR